MKILTASSAPIDGGAGISSYTRTLAAALSSAGHEVHYASPSHAEDSPAATEFLRRSGIVHVPTDRDANPVESARRVLDHVRDQGIEGCINNDNPVLQSIAPALEVPLVVVCHMDRRIVASLCTLHRSFVDHLVCISNDMQRTMIKRYGFSNTQCKLIHNGTTDPGRPASFEPVDPSLLRVVCAGGWHKQKGGPRILRSILEHRDAFLGVRVDWFGVVPESVQKRVADLPEIRFHGQVPQSRFHETLRAADALIFGSEKEGCPMTVLEAMANGTLPITTDGVGAMRWLIDTGREGFICHLSDWSDQLADCVDFLKRRPQVVGAIKQAARERYERDFTASLNAERILALLEQRTVDRSAPHERFEIVRWHRPVASPTHRLTYLERLRYRTGWLDRIGPIEVGRAP